MALTERQKRLADWVIDRVSDAVLPELIRPLLNYCVSMDGKLDEIAKDVRALKDEPFKSGFLYLEDASKCSDPATPIHDARRSFHRAFSLGQKLEAARAAYQVGLCWTLLQEKENARLWYERAFEVAHVAWCSAYTGLYKVRDPNKESLENGLRKAGVFTIVLMLPIIAEEIHNDSKMNRLLAELNALDEFIPSLIIQLQAQGSSPEELRRCLEAKHQHPPENGTYRSFEGPSGRVSMLGC